VAEFRNFDILSTKLVVNLAPWFTQYNVNYISRDALSHLLTHLVVHIIALYSSLDTITFCLPRVCPVLPHPTVMCPVSPNYAAILNQDYSFFLIKLNVIINVV
jgi:hypothetical protein